MALDLEQRWDRPLRDITNWTTPDSCHGAKFAHVRIADAYFTSGEARFLLVRRIKEQNDGSLVIVVGTSLQREELIRVGAAGGNNLASVSFTYGNLIHLLTRNRANGTGSGSGSEAWVNSQSPSAWNTRNELPNKTVIVFSVEPSMPAECAVALVALTKWIVDVGIRPGSLIRMLVMSPDEQPPPLVRLLKLNTGSQFFSMPSFVLDDKFDMDPTHGCTLVNTLADEVGQAISKKVVEHPQANHAVVCFPPWGRIDSLNLPAAQQGEGRHWDEVEVSRNDHKTMEMLGSLRGSRLIILMPNGLHLPVQLVGYQIIHLVLGSTHERPVYDVVTGQITHIDLPLSKQERSKQVLWASRVSGQATIYTEASSVAEFIAQGPGHRRLDVENRHMGGFIAAVSELKAWAIDPVATMQCFLRDASHLSHMINRLRRQGILTATSGSSLGLGLPKRTADLFSTVLPLVEWDHRVALFLSLPSSNEIVLLVKVQLAALLTVGLEDLVDLSPELPETRRLADYCWGYSKPLSTTGSMWLVLGLWKLAAIEYDDFNVEVNPMRLVFLDGLASVDRRQSILARERIRIISEAINAVNAVEVKVPMSAIKLELGELDDTQCREMQRDLFQSFLYQLTTGRPVADSAAGRSSWRFCDVSIQCNLIISSLLFRTQVDMDAIMKKDNAPEIIFGIYHGSCRTGRNTTMMDWTWIPTHIIAEWKSKNSNGETLGQMLIGDIERSSRTLEEV